MAVVQYRELGTLAVYISRKLDIAVQTYCPWKNQYGCLQAAEVRQLNQLRDESIKLK